MSRVIGIDPGIKGGICTLDGPKNMGLHPMPTSGKSIDWNMVIFHVGVFEGGSDLAVIEKVMPLPAKIRGGVGSLTSGINYGGIIGILTTLEIPFIEVPPQTWMKTVFAGHAWKKQKKYSTIWAPKRWPKVEFKASERCKKIHDGMTDAACLAEYGRLYLADNHNRGGLR